VQTQFRNGEDIHTATACEIFWNHPKDMTPEVRRVAKSITSGSSTGSPRSGWRSSWGFPHREADAHIKRYFERYPGVKPGSKKTLKEARETGSVRTLLGRVRYLPEITLQWSDAGVRRAHGHETRRSRERARMSLAGDD